MEQTHVKRLAQGRILLVNIPDIIYTRSSSKFNEKAESMSSVAQNGKILAKIFGVSNVARSAASAKFGITFSEPLIVIPSEYPFLCIMVDGNSKIF